MFDAVGDGTNISYKLVSGKDTAPTGFDVDAAGNVTYTGTGTELTVDDIAAIAAYVAGDTAVATVTATGNTATVSGLSDGYYYITTTLGSVVTVDSTNPNASVQEKNTVPTIDKKQKMGTGSFADDLVDANIGDTVNYQIVVTNGTGTNKAITVTDTMTAGISYTANSLKINGNAVADNADTDNWKVTVSDQTITIEFKAAYITNLGKTDTITVTYEATVNNGAAVDDQDANENKVVMTYSGQTSNDAVYVATYDFLLKKTDGTHFLDGAGFKLYDALTGGNEIKLSKDDTGYYVDANGSEEIMVDSEGGVNIRGLKPGTYYLEETTVPAGYNKLTARQEVTITTGATAAVEVTVVNNAGSELPSTGGMGTTVFYVIGGLLMAGAVVMLITKKRMA